MERTIFAIQHNDSIAEMAQQVQARQLQSDQEHAAAQQNYQQVAAAQQAEAAAANSKVRNLQSQLEVQLAAAGRGIA